MTADEPARVAPTPILGDLLKAILQDQVFGDKAAKAQI